MLVTTNVCGLGSFNLTYQSSMFCLGFTLRCFFRKKLTSNAVLRVSLLFPLCLHIEYRTFSAGHVNLFCPCWPQWQQTNSEGVHLSTWTVLDLPGLTCTDPGRSIAHEVGVIGLFRRSMFVLGTEIMHTSMKTYEVVMERLSQFYVPPGRRSKNPNMCSMIYSNLEYMCSWNRRVSFHRTFLKSWRCNRGYSHLLSISFFPLLLFCSKKTFVSLTEIPGFLLSKALIF